MTFKEELTARYKKGRDVTIQSRAKVQLDRLKVACETAADKGSPSVSIALQGEFEDKDVVAYISNVVEQEWKLSVQSRRDTEPHDSWTQITVSGW